jgi:threonine dehydrogenase-like Zn-dependent dehydrogenase
MKAIYFQRSIPRILLTLALKKAWSGAVYAPFSPLHFKEWPSPALPDTQGVRLKNKQCGICASDLHIAFVDLDPMVHPAAIPGDDRIYLGHEVISEVTEVGSDVDTLQIGDRVIMKSRFLNPTCHSQHIEPLCTACAEGNYSLCSNRAKGLGNQGVGGGWADEYTCDQSEVWRVPDALDDDAATLVEPLACGVRAVLRHPPKPREKALVIGCGMIGLGTLQALRAVSPDAEIYAAARYPQQQALARQYGATVLTQRDLLDATSELTDEPVYKGEFGNRTILGGFDVIYDCVGNDSTVQEALRATRAGGTVVIAGVHLHRMKVDLTPVWNQEVNLIGTIAHGREIWEGQPIDTFELTTQWLLDGTLSADGLITHRFPLHQWKQAIQTATNKNSGCIKVVLLPG